MRIGYDFSEKRRFFRKGDFRLVLLRFLEEGPVHGYELIKRFEAEFGGVYIPSPGVVYPALQWLVDEGFVRVVEDGNKRVYEITAEGKRFLEERREYVEEVVDRIKVFFGEEKEALRKSVHRLMRVLLLYYPDLRKEESERIASIIDEARKKIILLLEEGDRDE